jgi:hypothetical protein
MHMDVLFFWRCFMQEYVLRITDDELPEEYRSKTDPGTWELYLRAGSPEEARLVSENAIGRTMINGKARLREAGKRETIALYEIILGLPKRI